MTVRKPAMAVDNHWAGFLPKLALGAFGIMFTILLGYFIWLGTTVIDVRSKVTAIEVAVKSLNATRARQLDSRADSNTQRLNALEEEGEGTE